MGLSPGWADPYPWALPDQRLLLTGLDDGVYRLWAAADPGSWFKEANETNNATWVDIRVAAQVGLPPDRSTSYDAARPARPPGKASTSNADKPLSNCSRDIIRCL